MAATVQNMACLVGAQLDAGHGNDHRALANLFSFFFLLFFRSLHLYYVINIHKIHNSLSFSLCYRLTAAIAN